MRNDNYYGDLVQVVSSSAEIQGSPPWSVRSQSHQAPKMTYITHECYTQRERLVHNVSAPEN
ncbi:hypothetical protein MY4038_002989 [Beauveria bassiana]